MAHDEYKLYHMTAPQNSFFKGYENRKVPYKITLIHGDGTVSFEAQGKRLKILENGTVIDDRMSGATREIPVPPSKPEKISFPGMDKVKKHPWKEPEKYKEPPKYHAVDWGKTVCQTTPECCQPREIKHVAFDADNTIWDMNAIASSVTGPLKLIDENTVVELSSKPVKGKKPDNELENIGRQIVKGLSDEEIAFLGDFPENEPQETGEIVKTTVKLFPSFRQTLDELDKRGITYSIISLNTPGSVRRILETFGLANRFKDIRDSWENKGKVFADQTRKLGICPCNAAFVDDRRDHVQDVSDKCGLGLQIGKGKDIIEPVEIMKFIK